MSTTTLLQGAAEHGFPQSICHPNPGIKLLLPQVFTLALVSPFPMIAPGLADWWWSHVPHAPEVREQKVSWPRCCKRSAFLWASPEDASCWARAAAVCCPYLIISHDRPSALSDPAVIENSAGCDWDHFSGFSCCCLTTVKIKEPGTGESAVLSLWYFLVMRYLLMFISS